METYKQEIKEQTRFIVWDHAIDSLTINRRNNRILNPEYMEHLWAFVKAKMRSLNLEDTYIFNEDIFQDWTEYADTIYQRKIVSELKVALFCGPEPENDVIHLLKKGVRIENIYAFENDKEIFTSAVDSLHKTYPRLKIYPTKIEDFIQLHTVVFDIVYLDFTKSLLKEYKTIFKLLEANALSELSILAINTTIPEKTEENIEFLASYFLYNPLFEYGLIEDDEDEIGVGDNYGMFTEGCSAYGIFTLNELTPYIEKHFERAYSAFQTNFVITYSNLIKPIYSILNQTSLCNRIFKVNNLKKTNS